MKAIKVGVIGVGHMGKYHVKILSELDSIKLVGVADTSQKIRLQVAEEWGVQEFADYNKLLGKVDAVHIAVPTSYHYEVARIALAAGKHVLLEKPLAETVEQARELVALAEKQGAIFQVGHVERFNGAVQQLKKIILNPLCIITRRWGPNVGRITDAGVVMDLMIHDVDIIVNLIGDEIEHVKAVGVAVNGKHEDIATAELKFKQGTIATINASRMSQYKTRTLEIMQAGSFIFLDYANQDIQIHRQAAVAYMLTQEEIRYKQESFIEHIQVTKENPLKLEIEHFYDCIRKHVEPIVDNHHDIRSLEIVTNILHQIHNNT